MWKTRISLSITSIIVFFLLMATVVETSQSQEQYPNRPITVVYGFGPGFGDSLTRAICKAVEKQLGQPVVVESKIGATGSIGMNFVVKSKPDGYTLGSNFTSSYLILPHLRKLPYNPLADSVIIAPYFKYNFALAVKVDAPWNTFEDVIAYARKNPGKFTYGSTGVGVPQHIAMERVALKEGIKWTFVPFKSPSEAVVSCLGGHTDAVSQGSVDVISHVRAGKLKFLLILDDKRWPAFPNIPTILEKGYNFYAMSYGLINGPKGMPEPFIKRLEDAINKAKKDPSFIETLDNFQVEPAAVTGKEYFETLRSEYDEMGRVIKAIGLQEN